MKPEFAKGDIVHFHPYKERKPIEAQVVDIDCCIGESDRMEYKLEGLSKPLISRTTGKSIVESGVYNPISEKEIFRNNKEGEE